ncbi:MAG TPA: S8 family serine peptidase [Anaerolineae bacterium]|nr:S8 family serine peptidase [Anaerolineae bacterium]
MKKIIYTAVALSILIALAVSSLGFAKPGGNQPSTGYAIVEFTNGSAAQHANYKAWLNANAPWAKVVREYSVVLDGVAVELNGNSANGLAKGPGVKSVSPSTLYRPVMSESVPLINADDVWSALSVDPADPSELAGIKVGVIDSGIDDSHPFINSCRGPVEHDVFISGTNNFGAPDLVSDHGTHVAGTIGGCYTTGAVTIGGKTLTLAKPMSGVAPGVELHDYNVFPGYGAGFIAFGGSAFSHDIIAAVEQAVMDGMDVINLSLGGSVEGPHDILAEAIDRAVEAGTIAVISAGNEGNNLLTVGSPGTAANAITVAASSNAHFAVGTTINFNGTTLTAAEGDFNTFSPAVTTATSLTTPADGCSAIAEDLSGVIAVIDRGACTFTTKVRNAEIQGALGVIMVNNVGGAPISMAHDGTDPFPTIPAVMVGLTDGAPLKAHVPGDITVDSSGLVEMPATPDQIAEFSSVGPTPFDFRQKPDVASPGVNVLSSVFGGEYAFFQGTSMAAPHVTGSVALLLAGNPGMTPGQVKSAIVNNAVRNDDLEFGTFSGLVYGPLARGGGRLDVFNAYQATLFASPASIGFGGHTGGSPFESSADLTLENPTGSDVACSLSVAPQRIWAGVGLPLSDFVINPQNPGAVFFAPWAFTGGAGQFISFSSTSVSVPAGGSSTVSVVFDAGRNLSGTGWSTGDVVADCGSTTLTIPWSAIFQQGNGALNGHAPSGFLVDPEGNLLTPELGAVLPSAE